MKVLKQKNTLEKSITNGETYLEPCEISKMDLFGLTIFAKKFYHRFSIGFQIRLCNARRYLKVKYFENSQNLSKVVSLTCKFTIKLQSTAEVFF